MKAPLIHVASLIFNEPLAIYVPKLEAILRAVGPRLVADDAALDALLRQQSIQQRPALLDDAMVFDAVAFDAQAPRNGNGDDSKPYQLTPDGIAVIPVRGSLMKRYSFLSAASGLTTYQSLAQAATAAMADPQVKGIMLDIDSPGGTTHGCFELSDQIHALRGAKPIWACANDLAASAAYAIASAADRIWVTRTGGVGSIGVFALHADQSGFDEQAGVKYTYVFAGDKKVDGNPHEPLSKAAKSDIQAEVDRENGIFIATVARNRSGSASANFEKIQSTNAGVYFARNAVPLLADEVGTYQEALAALTAKVNGTMVIASGKVAILGEAGNNDDQSTTGAEKGVIMPKPDSEGKQATKADLERLAAAQQPQDDEDDDDKKKKDDGEDGEEAKGKKAARPAVATVTAPAVDGKAEAKQIAKLCQIAGAPELAAEYLVAGYSADKVMELLSERRVEASAAGPINSYVNGVGAGGARAGASVDAAIEQARILAANTGGPGTMKVKQSKALEQILLSNPHIYLNYLEEKDRVMSQISFSGGGRVLNDYVLQVQRRYLSGLSLSTAIDDVPTRRAM